MIAEDAYLWMTRSKVPGGVDGFDRHVAASILAVAISETAPDTPLSRTCGLSAAELFDFAATMFPHAADSLRDFAGAVSPEPDTEECSVRDLLLMHASMTSAFARPLAAMVARRCLSPNHLWQDLGLNDRLELSWLMERYFGGLARRNSSDMKWKRFLYRMVCSSEGFVFCSAPVCTECEDFDDCFGDESGESRLARIRNEERAAG